MQTDSVFVEESPLQTRGGGCENNELCLINGCRESITGRAFSDELCIRNKEPLPPVYHRAINPAINCFCFSSAIRLFMAAPPRSFRKCRAEVRLINIYLPFTRKKEWSVTLGTFTLACLSSYRYGMVCGRWLTISLKSTTLVPPLMKGQVS